MSSATGAGKLVRSKVSKACAHWCTVFATAGPAHPGWVHALRPVAGPLASAGCGAEPTSMPLVCSKLELGEVVGAVAPVAEASISADAYRIRKHANKLTSIPDDDVETGRTV